VKKRVLVVGLFLLFLVGLFANSASAYSNLVVFGDSLSDNGNVKRFTDGEIWVETLSASLGTDLYDFAFGGATTWYDNPAAAANAADEGYPDDVVTFLLNTGLQSQLAGFLPSVAGMDETLFSVWAGANDCLQFRDPTMAALNIGMALDTLYSTGARDILVGNLPNMGSTPLMNSPFAPRTALEASNWTIAFNAALDEVLFNFQVTHEDETLYFLDAYSIFSDYTPGSKEWGDLFWVEDGFHPSAAGHQLIADAAYAAVAPVPEPATMFLLGAGLIGLIGFRRKNRQ